MSVKGLCQICESAAADHQCTQRGALVCHIHYDEATGWCTDCTSRVRDTPDEP